MLNIKQRNLSLFQLNIIILKIIYIHVFPVLVSLQPEKCKPFQLSLSLEQKIESRILMGCAPFTMIPVYTLPAARNRLLWRKLYFEVQKRLLPIYVNVIYLKIRREKLCLSFAKKCIKSQRHFALFPVEPVAHNHQLRNVELFTVNYARTERYRKSAIPYMQRKLNSL